MGFNSGFKGLNTSCSCYSGRQFRSYEDRKGWTRQSGRQLRACRTEQKLHRTAAVLYNVCSDVSNCLVLPTAAVISVSVTVQLITTVISVNSVAHLQIVAVMSVAFRTWLQLLSYLSTELRSCK